MAESLERPRIARTIPEGTGAGAFFVICCCCCKLK